MILMGGKGNTSDVKNNLAKILMILSLKFGVQYWSFLKIQ